MAEVIQDEEQFQALIKAEQWYDSNGESDDDNDNEVDNPDTGPPVGPLLSEVQTAETPWEKILWQPNLNKDDPCFTEPVTASSDKELSIEDLLDQLDLSDDVPDFGEEEETQEDEDICVVGDKGEDGVEVNSDAAKEKTSSEDKRLSEPSASSAEIPDPNQVIKLGRTMVPNTSLPVEPVFDTGNEPQAERPKHYHIAYEIMTSERTYVQNLRLIEKVVHGAIKTAHLTGRPILPEQARKDIFVNVGEIYALNFDLLQELEDRIANWDSKPMIADVVAIRAPFFKLYTMYSASFDRAQGVYYKWLKRSKPFAKLIKTVESGRLCKGLPISSYMLCPIQRIPRYRLLLEDYLRHLPDGHPDAENAEVALAAIAEAAVHMNDRIKDLENQSQIVKMQKSFTGKETIVAPGRKYLGRGPVFFVPSHRKKQRVLFLFSDILLVAALTTYGRYKVRHKLSLKNLLVSIVESAALKNSFCVAETGMTKPFRFSTKTPDERNRWIRALKGAKAQNDEPFSTLRKNSKHVSLLHDPDVHSSILAVLTDPSFEHNQPSWVRRSLRVSHSARASLPISSGYYSSSHSVSGLAREEVDTGEGDVETEFVEDEKQEVKPTRALRPGEDNTLSSYMNQLGASSDVWRRRWFVLTSRTLVCYENHCTDEASGALPLTGYQLSVPEPADGVSRKNVFKMTCAGKRAYFFQLPSSYDFERWHAILTELLESEANQEGLDPQLAKT